MQLVYNLGVYGGGANEASAIMLPSTPPPSTGWKPIVYCHGFGATDVYTQQAFNGAVGNNLSNTCLQLVNTGGYALLVADLGVFNAGNTTDANNWGNANSMTRITNLISYARAQVPGIRQTGKVALYGASLGSVTALNYSIQNPGTVACSIHVLPCCNLTDIYVNNRQSLQSSVGNAWGVSFPTALPGTADPSLNTASGPTAPVIMFFASDDAICLPATVNNYANKLANVTAVPLGIGGHTDTTVGLMPMSTVFTFLTENYA